MGLKDVVARKQHKERAQPASRRHLGLLEKKKDYILRAKDFHKKEKTIKTLRRKAEERNPDEFYFAMEKGQTKNGVHVVPTAERNKYSQDELRLMKSQDVGYLTLKAQAELKKVEKMQANLHFLGVPTQNKHTVFVEDTVELNNFDPSTHFDTPAELLDRTFNRPTWKQLKDVNATTAGGMAAAVAARMEKKKTQAYKELLQRQERHQKLGGLAQEMAYKKEVMGRGRKRKLRPEEANGQRGIYRWKTERKK